MAGCEDEGEGDAMEEGGGRTPGADVDRFVRQADAGGVGERRGGGGWSAFSGGQAGRGCGAGATVVVVMVVAGERVRGGSEEAEVGAGGVWAGGAGVGGGEGGEEGGE
jgi:hypothetical protein